MPTQRLMIRVVVAGVAFAVVAGAMLLGTAMIAMAVHWDIPEGQPQRYGASTVFDRDGRVLGRFAASVESRPVELSEIDKSLQHAVIAAEDRRFYEHQGVDPLSVLRAVVRNVLTGSIAEGGSTLTQQYVKNAYVGSEQSLYRKVREAVVALQLEKERSKDEILEDYLNYVYFGEGAYGAEAAALTYFVKPASELTLAQSALLASTVAAPSRFSPRNDPGGARIRRNRVLDQMAAAGFIGAAEAAAAKQKPLGLKQRESGPSPAPFFVEQVRREVVEAYGSEKVYKGGLHIITTLDLKKHKTLQKRVRDRLPADPSVDMGAAAVDPNNGDILATYSGRDFQESRVNLAMTPEFGQQSGSAFKPVVLAAALEEGIDLSTVYPSGATTIGGTTVTGAYCGGACSLRQATAVSDNTVFFRLARDVGKADFTQMAYRLGMRSPDLDDARHGIGMALGTASITPLDMASAFGTFANQGVACPARTVLEVRNPAGPSLQPPDPRQPSQQQLQAWQKRLEEMGYSFGDEDLGRCYRALPPAVAGQVTEALQGVVAGGTGTEANIGRPQAGKTGTTEEAQELWFAGYTPNLSLTMYMGHPDRRAPLRLPSCGASCTGGNVMAPRWAHAAKGLLANVEPEKFIFPAPGTNKAPAQRRLGPPSPTGRPEPETRTVRPETQTPPPGAGQPGVPAPDGSAGTGVPTDPTDPGASAPGTSPQDGLPGEEQGSGDDPLDDGDTNDGSGGVDEPMEYEGLNPRDDTGGVDDPMEYDPGGPSPEPPSDNEPGSGGTSDPGDASTGDDEDDDGGLLF